MVKLNREALLAAPDFIEQELEVPEWGGSITLRSFSLKRRDEMVEAATVNDKLDKKLFTVSMLVNGIVEPALTMEDIERLREKSAVVCDKIIKSIMALNGIDEKGADKIKKDFRAE